MTARENARARKAAEEYGGAPVAQDQLTAIIQRAIEDETKELARRRRVARAGCCYAGSVQACPTHEKSRAR